MVQRAGVACYRVSTKRPAVADGGQGQQAGRSALLHGRDSIREVVAFPLTAGVLVLLAQRAAAYSRRKTGPRGVRGSAAPAGMR